MKLELPTNIFVTIQTFLSKHYRVMLFIFTLLLFSSVVLRINQLTLAEPTDQQINEKVKAINRPKLNQETITKMESLEAENSEAKSLFDNARNNPFISE